MGCAGGRFVSSVFEVLLVEARPGEIGGQHGSRSAH